MKIYLECTTLQKERSLQTTQKDSQNHIHSCDICLLLLRSPNHFNVFIIECKFLRVHIFLYLPMHSQPENIVQAVTAALGALYGMSPELDSVLSRATAMAAVLVDEISMVIEGRPGPIVGQMLC